MTTTAEFHTGQHWIVAVATCIWGRPGFDKLPAAHFKSSSFIRARNAGGLMSRVLKSLALILLISAFCPAQDLASFEKRVTVKKLPNGLTAIVCQRPDSAPVFSFYTNVDAGSVQDPMGKTGLAHMFEHMAFKGTDTIGSKNYQAEK